jgi:predicted enzyme related to lactoylglutathione lyase
MKGKIAKYVTVGTNDLERAKSFYDALFEDMGQPALDLMKEVFFGLSQETTQILQYLCLTMVKRQLLEMEAW